MPQYMIRVTDRAQPMNRLIVHELEGRIVVELVRDLLLELLRRELQDVAGGHQAG